MARKPKPIKVRVQRLNDRPNLVLQWRDPVTARVRTESTGTTDPAIAEELRAKREYELRQGIHAEPSKMQWAAFLELYVAEKLAGRREGTRDKARRILTQFGDLANVRRVADVDERAVSQFAARLRERAKASSTIAGSLAYLRAALRWAARQKFIGAVPAVEMPKLPRRSHIRVISDFEWGKIIGASPPAWVPYLWTLWHTGMRRNEAAELRWARGDGKAAWVDLEAKRIWIPAESAKADSDDWLPIRAELQKILRPLARPAGKCFSGLTQNVSKVFGRICDEAGVKGITLQATRRTFGTRLAPHVPAHVLKRLMRHSSIETTLKFYVSLDSGLADAIERGV